MQLTIFIFFIVTLGFFDDILIPPTALQHPSRFEETEQAWVWEYPLEEGEKHDLFMDIGEPIKFRVTGDIFEESSPIGPPNPADKPSSSSQSDIKTPYRILVSFHDSNEFIDTQREVILVNKIDIPNKS